jgi:hypothetical protein
VRYIPQEARRLNRPPPAPVLVRFIMRLSWLVSSKKKRDQFMKMSGYVMFGPT